MNQQISNETITEIRKSVDIYACRHISKVLIERGISYDWDDYDVYGCIYFDLDENKIKTDVYGHGQQIFHGDKDYVIYNDVKQIVGLDYIIKQSIIDWINKHYLFEVVLQDSNLLVYDDLRIPCSIKSGRKLRGDDLILRSVTSYYDFFGRRDWKYLVCDPKTKRMCWVESCRVHINFDKMHIDDIQADQIEMSVTEMAHIFAYDMSYAHCDGEKLRYLAYRILLSATQMHFIDAEPLDDYVDPWEEQRIMKRRQKQQEAYEENLPKITEWAHNKFSDKTEEEIQEIINRTMKKYYKFNI